MIARLRLTGVRASRRTQNRMAGSAAGFDSRKVRDAGRKKPSPSAELMGFGSDLGHDPAREHDSPLLLARAALGAGGMGSELQRLRAEEPPLNAAGKRRHCTGIAGNARVGMSSPAHDRHLGAFLEGEELPGIDIQRRGHADQGRKVRRRLSLFDLPEMRYRAAAAPGELPLAHPPFGAGGSNAGADLESTFHRRPSL